MSDIYSPPTRPRPGEDQADYRTRLEAQQAEAVARREREIAEQRSPLNSPSERIRIWERRHQLPLPRRPDHALLSTIVTDTGLTLEDVHAEQQQRAAAKIVPPAG